MVNRRSAPLGNRPVTWIAKDAEVGGIGLDWETVPADVAASDDARQEWERLAAEFRSSPARFREGDRRALAGYCTANAVVCLAVNALLTDGLLVDGRSRADAGRKVKSPALSAWTAASGVLRLGCRELGLSPDARARQGIIESHDGNDRDDERAIFGDDDLLGRPLR